MGLIQKQKKNYSLKCFKLLFKLKSNKALKAHSCLLKKKKTGTEFLGFKHFKDIT